MWHDAALVPDPTPFPEGFSVDAVDWLPSGARSGLVRVRGHRPPAVAGPLPELVLESGGQSRRFVSLPDPRADRDPSAWRGAYVLDARPVAEADALWLEWPGGRRLQLPPLTVPASQVEQRAAPAEPRRRAAADIVDRAVMAERRARKAEAAEQAQARIAREALRAVEVLELRAGELEQQVAAAEAERDALRSQAADGRSEPDVRMEVLHAEVRGCAPRWPARSRAPPRVPEAPAPVAPIAAIDAERRAERLRSALTATVATVAELRLRLHERDVARRTRDVAISAEPSGSPSSTASGRRWRPSSRPRASRLREAQPARDEAAAEVAGVRAAHEDLQARHREVSAELGAARERHGVPGGRARVAGARGGADRGPGGRRLRPARAPRPRRVRPRARRARRERETARELAEAAALAAAAGAARAAVAARRPSRPAACAEPGRRSAPHREPEPRRRPNPLPHARAVELAAAAEAAKQSAGRRAASPEDDAVVADLDAAREKLRQRPTIISPAGQPPADVARGRGGREYPPLRGALVKLAHDDPKAAGLFLAGLLSAQHAALDDPAARLRPDHHRGRDLRGLRGRETTLVSPLDAPRGRGQAAFHVTADALTLAETLAGVENRARRFRGPLRVTGKARQARQLTDAELDVSFGDVVRAGADLDPYLVLRALAYAIRPPWTQGQVWSRRARRRGPRDGHRRAPQRRPRGHRRPAATARPTHASA